MALQELLYVDAEHWQAALAEATEECLDVLVCPATGEAFVESGSHPGTLYVVSATSCSCAAGQHGHLCKHLACYRAQMGLLPLGPDSASWAAVA